MPSITKISLVAAALAVSASAHGNSHGHLHRNLHQRAYAAEEEDCGTKTLTKTVWVQPSSTAATTYCGVKTETKTVYGPSPVSSSSSVYKASSSSVYVAPPPPSSYVAPKPSTSVYVAPSPAPKPKPSAPAYGSGSAPIVPNGNKWAMTYTTYNDDSSCKTADQVDGDLAKIKEKGFTTVRVYATNCQGVVNIGNAADKYGLKMIVGIWIDNPATPGVAPVAQQVAEQSNELQTWGKQNNNWNKVEMVVVGNEAIFGNLVTPGELASYISTVKSDFKASGYTGVVTTTEPINVIKANGGVLCPVVDVIAANIHPYFNPTFGASDAGTLVANTLTDLAAVCNNSKDAYNLETGWPTGGNANGNAIPGYDTQKIAIDAILSSSGKHSVFFSYANDMWKPEGEFDVERHWGCADAF